ncbi:MAG TPA: CbiX/SirB N-terminal domain-containing protein [Azospirillum sp.]
MTTPTPPAFDASPPGDAALLLFAHGTSDGGGAAIATALADELRQRGPFGAVGTSFALQSPSPAEALAALPQRRVVVVPLLATEGGVARMVLPRLLAESGDLDRLTVLEPIGLDPEVAGIAADLADSAMAGAGLDPARTGLLVAGHGSVRRPASERSTTALVDALAATRRYAEVAAIYLEQPPLASGWRTVTSRTDVVVVPFFLSGGHHEEEDLPAMLRDGGGAPDGRLDGRVIDGRRLWLTPAVGRHPRLADLIRRRALAALDQER